MKGRRRVLLIDNQSFQVNANMNMHLIAWVTRARTFRPGEEQRGLVAICYRGYLLRKKADTTPTQVTYL